MFNSKKTNFFSRKYRHVFVLIFIFFCMVIGWYACSSDGDKKTGENKTGSDSLKFKKDSLDRKIGIEMLRKEFQNADSKDNRDYNVIVYRLTNNTDKNIKEIEADVLLNDASGNEVKKVKITFNDKLPAKGNKEYKALYNC